MLKQKLLATCLAAALTVGVAGVAPTAAAATPSAPAVAGTKYPELVARAQALSARLPKDW